MKEILILAYKLLVNDKGKYTALLVGTTFSVFLIVQMTSSFAGILTKASATVINVGASIWVMDPAETNSSSAAFRCRTTCWMRCAASTASNTRFRCTRVRRWSSCVTAPISRLRSSGLTMPACLEGRNLSKGHIDDIFAENGFIVGQG